MELNDYIDRHSGQEAWIFGKGPSLDSFNFDLAGPIRVGINDLVGVVPGCLYGFSNDRIDQWFDMYHKGHTLFIPKRTADYYKKWPACEVVVFEDHHGYDKDYLTKSKAELCKELQLRPGSLGSAMQVLHIMGIKRFMCVGIDGGNNHAKGHKWRTDLWNEHYKQYNEIRTKLIEGAEQLGIEVQFWKGTQMKDGYKTVHIKSNILVRGIHYEGGMVVELKEKDARDVVGAGRGVIVPNRKIIKSPVAMETAAVEKPVEVPTKRTRRPARKTAKKRAKKK